ncbi:MAG TPA: ATP-binding protein [Thermoanaerobaculia bacterium]|nr:ATP-binding protein [Thermoanaerobaculia bacterium]
MIVRSLRWRLLIAVAIVIVAVIATAGIFSSLTVKKEFDRFLVAQRTGGERESARLVLEHYGRTRSWRGVAPVLEEIWKTHRMQSVIVDDRKRVVIAYPPRLASYRITIGERDEIELTRRSGGTIEALVLHGARFRIGDGMLFLLPPGDALPDLRRSFRGSVDRWLLAGLAIAALAALAIVVMISRRVFAPVEALTAGARALASGKLDARVAVRGDDEIGELASAFNAMAESVERNERARRNLTSDVAHELRTPLTNIRCQIEAVQDGLAQPDAKLFASLAEEAAMLHRLIEDLQQLSIAESGHLRLEKTDVVLRDAVERAVGGLNVQIDVPADMVVHADALRLVQVVRNLVVNALTHARTTVIVRARDGELRVIDDGPGVPPEHAQRIFDRFHRADPSRSRTTGGAGLGLAIAKQLVELHGGTLRLENRPGEGATFVVTLINS